MSNHGTVKIVLHKEWTVDLSSANPDFDMQAVFEALEDSGDIEEGDSADSDNIHDAFRSVLLDDCQSEKDEITGSDFEITVSPDALIESSYD